MSESRDEQAKGKLELAILSKVFPPFSYGGTESYALELAEQLGRREDVELHVLCFQSAENPVPEEDILRFRQDKPYTLHVVGDFFKSSSPSGSLPNYWKTYRSLTRILEEIRPQLLQTLGVYSETVLAMNVAKKLNIPAIVFPRGSDLNQMGALQQKVYRRQVFSRAAAVFSQTRTAEERLKQLKLVEQGKEPPLLRVVPNAIDLSSFEDGAHPAPGEGRPFRALWVGRFEEVKDPVAALEVFTLFLERYREKQGEETDGESPGLVMVGDGSLFQVIKEKAADIPEVELKGRLQREELFTLMRDCHVLMNTSRSEGFPVSFLEAMASGLPVCAFDVSANAEIIRDGENGFVVARRDSKAFAGRLLELLENPECGMKMGARNRKDVRNYDWKLVLGEMLGLYRELAGLPGSEKD